MSMSQMTLNINLLSDLKAAPVDANTQAFLLGKSSIGDGLGGFFYWDPNATMAEDLNTMNAIVSSLTSTGRWMRIFQRTRTLPQGILGFNGSIKVLYASGVTDASGLATLNLTLDNTTTGTKIFTEIWSIDANAKASAAGSANAILSYNYAQTLSAVSFGFIKGNATTFALGQAYQPFLAIGAGQAVNFRIEGI